MNRNINEENNAPLLVLCLLAFLLIVMFSSCKARIQYVPIETIKTEVEIIRDTIVVYKLDVIRDTIIVSNDTISHLQNKYADSWAMWSMGRLHHSLNIKDVDIPIHIKYIDKLKEVYVDKPIEVEVIKYKDKPYTWYEKLLMAMGIFSVAYFGLLIFRRFK